MLKYNDYPLMECARTLEPLVAKGCTFNQKWTCQHCGSRQAMAEVNKLFTSGICEECGKETKITACNYMLHAIGPGPIDAALAGKNKP